MCFLTPQLSPVLLCCLKYMNSIHSRTLMLLTLPCHWIVNDYSDVTALVVTCSEFWSHTCLMVFPRKQAMDELFFLNQIQVVVSSLTRYKSWILVHLQTKWYTYFWCYNHHFQASKEVLLDSLWLYHVFSHLAKFEEPFFSCGVREILCLNWHG